MTPPSTKELHGQFVMPTYAPGITLARGLAEYDCRDAAAITGLSTAAIAERLGVPPRAAFIHREHMVML